MDFVDHPFPHIYIPSNLSQRYEMIYQYKNYNKPNKIQTKLCPNKLAKFQLSMNIESMNIFNSSMLNWMQLEEICTELHIQRPLHLFLLSALHLPHCHHHQVPSQTTVKYFPLFKSSITQAQCIILWSFESSISHIYIQRKYLFVYVLFLPLPRLVSLGKAKTA